ncbi:MAG TPA: hypothetical protein VF427_12645, partial [Noviherbaspirillum sp.]
TCRSGNAVIDMRQAAEFYAPAYCQAIRQVIANPNCLFGAIRKLGADWLGGVKCPGFISLL